MKRYHYAPVTLTTYVDAILTDAADDLAFAQSIAPAGRFAFFGQAAV